MRTFASRRQSIRDLVDAVKSFKVRDELMRELRDSPVKARELARNVTWRRGFHMRAIETNYDVESDDAATFRRRNQVTDRNQRTNTHYAT